MRFKEETQLQPKKIPFSILFFAPLYFVVRFSVHMDLFYFTLYGCMEKDIRAFYAFVSVLIFKVMFNKLLFKTLNFQGERIAIRNYLDLVKKEQTNEEKARKIRKYLFSKN